MIRRRPIFALFAVLILTGCAYLRPAAPAPEVSVRKEALTASSIRAEALVELEKGTPLSGRASIFVKSPASFRIEVKGPLGSSVASFISDGKEISIFSEGVQRIYGPEDPDMPYPLKPEELVLVLLGVNAGQLPAGYKVTADTEGHITGFSGFKDGVREFSAAMSDFKAVDGVVLPFTIRIETGPKNGTRILKIRYTKIEINPDIKEDVFEITRFR